MPQTAIYFSMDIDKVIVADINFTSIFLREKIEIWCNFLRNTILHADDITLTS